MPKRKKEQDDSIKKKSKAIVEGSDEENDVKNYKAYKTIRPITLIPIESIINLNLMKVINPSPKEARIIKDMSDEVIVESENDHSENLQQVKQAHPVPIDYKHVTTVFLHVPHNKKF